MSKYTITLKIVVEADTISDVDDDQLGNAIISLPEVLEVSTEGISETP